MGNNRKLTKHQLKKRSKGICIEFGCGKKAAKGRTICYHHNYERFKANHPVKWAYGTLRRNAKRRGKEFDITLGQFELFCEKTKILLGRGRTKDSYHIDRIDENRGYTIDNIQVLTNTQNLKKYRDYNYMSGEGTTRTVRYGSSPDLPF